MPKRKKFSDLPVQQQLDRLRGALLCLCGSVIGLVVLVAVLVGAAVTAG